MQKIIIVCVALFATVALSASVPETVEIISSSAEQEPDGSYVFSYEGADGNKRQEAGKVLNPGTDEASLSISGSYKYTDPADGETYEVTYTADENGFVPKGKHIHEEIVAGAEAAVEWARSHPEPKH